MAWVGLADILSAGSPLLSATPRSWTDDAGVRKIGSSQRPFKWPIRCLQDDLSLMGNPRNLECSCTGESWH